MQLTYSVFEIVHSNGGYVRLLPSASAPAVKLSIPGTKKILSASTLSRQSEVYYVELVVPTD